MDYYNTHLRKTSDPKLINLNKLERGMVIKMRYKKENITKDYLVLVLHSRWEDKMYGLSLNNIQPEKFLEIAKNYKEIIAESTRVRKLDLAKLNILDKTPKGFYQSEIKNDKKLREGYRMFNIDKIQSIRAVNYDWGRYDRIKPESERNKDK
jgi:hypothetical protein